MKEGVGFDIYERTFSPRGGLLRLNPATTAAAAGHNFSSRSNRFWTVLHFAGFTDVRPQPHEQRRLLDYG
jgi:G:T/U-mismatch repair DNA glycosylase